MKTPKCPLCGTPLKAIRGYDVHGITTDWVAGCYNCFFWGVQDPVRISTVPLSDIGMTRPPQSWQYLTDEQADILERRLA